jgi:hypothetical protein
MANENDKLTTPLKFTQIPFTPVLKKKQDLSLIIKDCLKTKKKFIDSGLFYFNSRISS